jgi:hypothetical protein
MRKGAFALCGHHDARKEHFPSHLRSSVFIGVQRSLSSRVICCGVIALVDRADGGGI